jgi:hypothetical protein
MRQEDVIVVVVVLLVVVAEVSRAVEEVIEGTDNGAFTLTGKRVVVAVGERRLRSRVTTATTAFSVVARIEAAAAAPHRGMQSGSNTRLLRPESFRVVDGYCKVTPPCFNAGLLVLVVVVAVVEATTSCAEDSSRTRAIANGNFVQGESAGRRSIFKSSSRSVVFPHCCVNRSMDRSRITDQ